ncbi:bifunctional NAD(P)/FAD-dependent oxidoreductase/class I SAM-dependent methyltransferase [Nonomuraea roseola]|uniref:Bifunctional NAD(P)/FAD-dependent oxidoreductase/class I SAM-dependent methyltransferase n=1 Tax=Nonomuraea roseola TaxID=46179 RepID=A0ABV5QAU0_9ACTN
MNAQTEQTGDERRYDVVVVGGGAAGLSGALTLARARRTVLVIDAGQPRNAPAGHVHGYLAREGVSPADLLAAGRAEVSGYGGQIVRGSVVAAERASDGFRVRLDDGSSVVAGRLLVTTGLVDELPDVRGLAERWGREVLHCPYCHGWEVRDQAIGVLADGPFAVHQALLWRQWSSDVTLFLHTQDGLGDDEREQLAARDISVVEGPVAALEVSDDRLTGVRLADGRVLPCEAVVVAPRLTARTDVLTGLGLEPTDQEMGGHVVGSSIAADPSGATAVQGVWVAGNVANLTEQVIGAAGAGVRAGAAINADLIDEETRQAVASRRHRSHHRAHDQRDVTEQEFWDSRYAGSDRIWSGNPNVALVREAADLEPGTALDLGCGEGGDAVWLAARGWRVTATDISRVALERAAAHAKQAGVADRIDWQQHDLGASFPEGSFDLVSAHFLHSPGDMPREKILRFAAAAVAPGGVLLIVGHAGFPSWEPEPHPAVHLPTPQEVLESLELPEGQWEVQRCEEYEREQTSPDGRPGTRLDNILRVRRTA